MWIPLLPALAACHQYPPGVCRAGDAAPVEVRLAFDDRSNAPVALPVGQSLAGVLAPPGTLRVDAVAVQIGNDRGAVEGELALKLCQAGRCSEGKADVTAVKDNDYLTVMLNPSLPISYAAGPIHYELQRISGKNTLTLWAYPSLSAAAGIEEDGTVGPHTLNFLFRQQ